MNLDDLRPGDAIHWLEARSLLESGIPIEVFDDVMGDWWLVLSIRPFIVSKSKELGEMRYRVGPAKLVAEVQDDESVEYRGLP